MAGNSFGTLFKVSTFGESHGVALGLTIDGCPAGLEIDPDFIQSELMRRRPGQSKIVTQRKEGDKIEILSGIFEGKSTGTPIGMVIYNKDQKSRDYDHIKDVYRPSHADFTFQEKFGHRDYRGGGRSSARETAARVAAGAVAKLLLKKEGIQILSHVSQVGDLKVEKALGEIDFNLVESNPVRCADPEMAIQMEELIRQIRKEGDTIGGTVTALIKNCPVGLGEPVFDKLQAQLAGAMLSINAAKGFEYGSGFSCINMRGSEHNDAFKNVDGKIITQTNYSGGIQGGISNGMDIYFRVAFKPVATIMKQQETVNKFGGKEEMNGKGRHDPCVLPRAVPIVEAMAALVLADSLLIARSNRL